MKILEKIKSGDRQFTDYEIIEMLKIDVHSPDFYELISLSNQLSRSKFGNKGYVFAQIGINAEPCTVNCKFCSLGSTHYSLDSVWQKTTREVIQELKHLQAYSFDDFFLMTTANYSQNKCIALGTAIKPLLREKQKMVANIGDFDSNTALALKEAGFTGAYHINRLREGVDTEAKPEERENTIQAILDAGLELYYCIEPIGPEHSYEEIVVEINRARQLKIEVMAVMRRTAVKGTPLQELGQISALELTKIAAVTNLVVNPARSMNVHEPMQMSLLAGVNQLYAESGANPRDNDSHTENNRGFTPDLAWKMLKEADYTM